MVTQAERKSKLYLIKQVKNKEAEMVKQAIIKSLMPYKADVPTMTFDNGGKFAGHEDRARALNA